MNHLHVAARTAGAHMHPYPSAARESDLQNFNTSRRRRSHVICAPLHGPYASGTAPPDSNKILESATENPALPAPAQASDTDKNTTCTPEPKRNTSDGLKAYNQSSHRRAPSAALVHRQAHGLRQYTLSSGDNSATPAFRTQQQLSDVLQPRRFGLTTTTSPGKNHNYPAVTTKMALIADTMMSGLPLGLHTPMRPHSVNEFDTPAPFGPSGHIEPSNVRGSINDDPFVLNTRYDVIEDNIFDTAASLPAQDSDNANSRRASTPPEESPAFAAITFPDCILYIRCTEFDLGRDESFYKEYKAKLKAEKKANKRRHAGKLRATRRDSESLDGRPEPGLLSTYSEHGGVVGWNQSESLKEDSRPSKRRKLQVFGPSSSANSVAPQSLHLADGADNDATSSIQDLVEFVPLHPPLESDITNISRKHLHFSLGPNGWVVYITGNGAYINDRFHPRDSDRQIPISIKWGDEIRIATLVMVFHTADGKDKLLGNSPASSSGSLSDVASQISSVDMEVDDTEDLLEDGKTDLPEDRKNPKLKLKLKHRAPSSPEDDKNTDKSKKRKAPDDGFDETGDAAGRPVPPEMADDSLLAGETELPAPRKGPGRPPKNGSYSKRDQTAMKRKEKEYTAKGLPVPHVAELLEMVRREQKENDAKKKARGENSMPDVLPSIEAPAPSKVENVRPESREGNGALTGAAATVESSSLPAGATKERSRSPVKPKEECDENDLKKPMDTYPVLIAIVLNNEPNRTADLQRIYYLMEKRWPYYRWCTEGKGWQSSVRHNLRDNQHFKEAGKSGKGHYWTIDDNFPLESKKNKRPPTPPPHLGQPQGPNRAGPNGMVHGPPHGNQGAWNRGNGQLPAGYNNHYGPNGTQGYGSQGSTAHHSNGVPAGGVQQPHAGQHNHQQGQSNGTPSAQPPRPPNGGPQVDRDATPPPPDPMTDLINQIIRYRHQYYQLPENRGKTDSQLNDLFRHATEHFSNDLHNLQNYMLPEAFREQAPAKTLKEIFDKYGSSAPAYYVRQALGASLPSVPGTVPNVPEGLPQDNVVYPALTTAQIQEYVANGVGQAAYNTAVAHAQQERLRREAELAVWRRGRDERRAAQAAHAARVAAAAQAAQRAQPPANNAAFVPNHSLGGARGGVPATSIPAGVQQTQNGIIPAPQQAAHSPAMTPGGVAASPSNSTPVVPTVNGTIGATSAHTTPNASTTQQGIVPPHNNSTPQAILGQSPNTTTASTTQPPVASTGVLAVPQAPGASVSSAPVAQPAPVVQASSASVNNSNAHSANASQGLSTAPSAGGVQGGTVAAPTAQDATGASAGLGQQVPAQQATAAPSTVESAPAITTGSTPSATQASSS